MKKLLVGLNVVCGLVARGDVVIDVPFPRDPAGNTATAFPFLIKQGGLTSMRYQQVYAASAFSALDPGGEMITTMVFDPDNPDPNRIYGWSIPSIQISLSTTHQAVDSLSPVLALNVGADDRIIFGPTTLNYVGGIGDALVFYLAEPFFYDPALGNLLLDVRVFDGRGDFDIFEPAFDAQATIGDAISCVFATDVNALVGDPFTTGLRTGFATVSIPEPSFHLLLVNGGIALFAFIRSRRIERI